MIDVLGVIVVWAIIATWIDKLNKSKALRPYRMLQEPQERRRARPKHRA
jgi:hypothetical protein